MDFPAGYLPSYHCIFCCFLPRAAALTPCASPGIPSDACYKCKCPNVPLTDPNTEAWVGLRTLDFHQVITQVTLLPEASDQTWRNSVRDPFILTVVGPDAPQGSSEGLWFSRVSRSQALGPGWERWQRKYEHGRKELGAHMEKSLSCLALHVFSAASWRVPSPCLGFE